MSDITLKDTFGGKNGYERYARGEGFDSVNINKAWLLGWMVAEEMKKREDRAGESVIWIIMYAMPQQARAYFLESVGGAFGGTKIFLNVERERTIFRRFGSDGIKLTWTERASSSASELAAVPWKESRFRMAEPVTGIVIIPTGKYVVIDGEMRTYSFQLYRENTNSNSLEKSVEIYTTIEGGVSMPPIPLISFSVKDGVKAAAKYSDRRETKNGSRATDTISKALLVQKIKRPVLSFGDALGTFSPFDKEIGYVITRKEGGDTIGPFWPQHRLGESDDDQSALKKSEEAIKSWLEAAAQEFSSR